MFQPVTFTPPSSVDSIAAGLSSSLDAIGSTLASGAGRLSSLGGASSTPAPGLNGLNGMGDMGDMRGQASGMFAEPVPYLAVTPYQRGVGQHRGEHAYLTPTGAIRAVGTRLGDMPPLTTGGLPDMDTGLVLVVMAAPDAGRFATSLQRFNAVMPLVELQQAQRRAGALATLEEDKFKVPPAPGYPAWGKASPRRGATGRATDVALGAQLALGEGHEAATASPLERLQGFATRQAATMQRRRADLASLGSSMTGTDPGWFGIYLEGLVAEVARLLVRFVPPLDDAFKCCAAVCWYGRRQQVAYYKEAFGLRNPLEGIDL
ncbi:hypothetical protein [Nitratidesulfovibrio vulgaris]|uniref:hypothetical protein n=1 Tax=Nitratidesulfovibrio vulgaris TaxID=881 RepID=UPI0013DFFCEF|nr:hypothetical protein [Nitratidesulfovibrio vulgaris]